MRYPCREWYEEPGRIAEEAAAPAWEVCVAPCLPLRPCFARFLPRRRFLTSLWWSPGRVSAALRECMAGKAGRWREGGRLSVDCDMWTWSMSRPSSSEVAPPVWVGVIRSCTCVDQTKLLHPLTCIPCRVGSWQQAMRLRCCCCRQRCSSKHKTPMEDTPTSYMWL